jgi:hypothetical protein
MLCQISRDANDYITGWMNRQPEVKEESITDWLLDFYTQHTNEIRYYQFNRYEEGRHTGADWDWWILLRNGCFKLRIQAKKIRLGHNHYTDLTRNNQNGFQIDILLNSSSEYNFYPLYSIYGHSEGVERCQHPKRPLSLHICSAQEVYDLIFNAPRRRINSSDILQLTIPLECLFCCPLVRDGAGIGPRKLFDHYFGIPPLGRNNEEQDDNFNRNRGFEQNVPRNIASLFEMKETNDNSIGLIEEYRSMYPGSKALGIIKVREPE